MQTKIMLIGNSGVGKETVASEIAGDEKRTDIPGWTYNQANKNIRGQNVNLSIFQSPFPSPKPGSSVNSRVTGNFTSALQRMDIIILQYDITNKKSFTDLNEWLEWIPNSELSPLQEGCVKVVLGNKVDLGNREVDRIEAEDFARANGAMYIEVSAINGTNVDVFLENAIVNRYPELANRGPRALEEEPIISEQSVEGKPLSASDDLESVDLEEVPSNAPSNVMENLDWAIGGGKRVVKKQIENHVFGDGYFPRLMNIAPNDVIDAIYNLTNHAADIKNKDDPDAIEKSNAIDSFITLLNNVDGEDPHQKISAMKEVVKSQLDSRDTNKNKLLLNRSGGHRYEAASKFASFFGKRDYKYVDDNNTTYYANSTTEHHLIQLYHALAKWEEKSKNTEFIPLPKI